MASKPVRSNTKKAKEIIRQEIRWCFAPKVRGYGKSSLDNMREAANSASHDIPKWKRNNYTDALRVVDGAYMNIATQGDMLGKIYGKDKVKKWDGEKRHEVYRHLVAREYDAMNREDAAKKAKAKRTRFAEKPVSKKK